MQSGLSPDQQWRDRPASSVYSSPWGANAAAVQNAPWYAQMKEQHTFKRRMDAMNIPYYTAIDCKAIASTNNFAALETLLPDLTLSNVSHADAASMTAAQVVNLVRVMQLGLEYLDGVRAALLANADRAALHIQSLETGQRSNSSSLPSARAGRDNGTGGGMSPEQYTELMTVVRQAAASAAAAAARPVAAPAPVATALVPSAATTEREARLQSALDRASVEIAQLRQQLGEFAATIQARDVALATEFERRDAERRDTERAKYQQAMEVEEKTRKLRQEQEILNRERLLNLEKERLERARLAMELERQQQDSAANKAQTDVIELQRQLMLQLQMCSAALNANPNAMAAQQPPALLPPTPAPLPALMPPMPAAATALVEAAPAMAATAPLPPTAPQNPPDDYRLYISCQDLPKTDWFSQADPFFVIFTAPKHSIPDFSKAPTPGWSIHTITPVIWDSPNPTWPHPMVIRWQPGEDLALHFQLWDSDTKDAITINNYMKQEFIGSAALTLQSVCAPDKLDKMWSFQLLSQKGKPLKSGRMQIRAVSTNAEQDAERRRREEENARADGERRAREAAEEAERRRREEEAKLAAELESLRRKQAEDEAARRGKEEAMRLIAERERELEAKRKELENHLAMEGVYAERMNAMVVYKLRTACKAMPERHGRSSDPFVLLMSTELQKGLNGVAAQPPKVVGMTEVAASTVNPEFYKPLTLMCPEFEDQMLEFQGWQSDVGGAVTDSNYDQQTFVGSATLALQQLIKTPEVNVTVPFSQRGKPMSTAVTVVLRRDEAECQAWKAKVVELLDKYHKKADVMRGEIAYLERSIQDQRQRLHA